jgi:RNA ligase (TIGR02306 family)
MLKSTHKVEVVPVKMEKHPNADSLSIIPIFGYSYVGRTEDWQDVNVAAWCPPDSLVDTRLPEFAFLAGEAKYAEDSTKGGPYARIRAKKLRGIVSCGLLIPLPANSKAQLGDDLAESYGVLHYEPCVSTGQNKTSFYTGGEVESGPNLYSPKYDVDSFQRYAQNVFVEGEPVFVSEKTHGANGRWVYHNGRMYCGSRTEWKREYAQIPLPNREDLINKLVSRMVNDGSKAEDVALQAGMQADVIIENIKKKNEHPVQNAWWKGLAAHPELRQWCENHPDVIVYGELYGAVQNLKYGVPDGQVRIAVFDLLNQGNWVDPHAARLAAPELPWVPTVAWQVPYDFNKLVEMAEGQSLVPGAKHYREGIVVSPLHERIDQRIGRVKLKIVSPTYLERS